MISRSGKEPLAVKRRSLCYHAHPRFSKEEIARRGKEWYEQRIRAKVEEGNTGKVLVIDVETGDYELDDDQLAAAHRALAKHPGAALYGMRIGYPAMGKIGGGWGRLRR